MGKFSKLLQGKGQEVKIGDMSFEITPLAAKYMGLFVENEPGKQFENMLEIVTASLQHSDKTITLEDVKELPMSELNKLITVIMDVNEMSE